MQRTTGEGWRGAWRRTRTMRRRSLARLAALSTVMGRRFSAVRRAQALDRDDRPDESVEHWRAIRDANPDRPGAHTGYAAALQKLERFEEAHRVLGEAVRRFPDDLHVRVDHAVAQQTLGRFQDGVAEGLAIIRDFPKSSLGYECAGSAHRRLLQFDEAEAVLVRGLAMCPDSLGVATERAATADERGEWTEGLARWQDVCRRFPDAAIGSAGVGAALRRLKRWDEADAVLQAAMARFPANTNLGVNHAWIAEQRGDWPEALRRWTALRQLFPNDARVRLGWVECTGKASLAEADRLAEAAQISAAPPALPPASHHGEDRHADLFKQFESLGENCEFGFVQRHFGAEPLGLLRWAGLTFGQLVHGLAAGFDSVGSVETTELNVNPNNHEYYTSDRVYGLSMHTFIFRDEGQESVIFQRLRRRLGYLRDKLIDDLKTAEKIFIFQSAGPISDEQVRHLRDGVRRYGPATLLCIRTAEEPSQVGRVVSVGEGLLVGYLDRVGFDGRYWNISFDVWLRLCEQALALGQAGVEAVSP